PPGPSARTSPRLRRGPRHQDRHRESPNVRPDTRRPEAVGQGGGRRVAAAFPRMSTVSITMKPPTFEEILAAQRRLDAHLRPTPLHRYAALDELIGAEVFVKHE